MVEAAFRRLATPKLVASLSTPAAPINASAEARHNLDDAASQLEDLARVWAEKRITLREYLAARPMLEKRMEAARDALNMDTRTPVLSAYMSSPSALRHEWTGLSLARQRTIIAALMLRGPRPRRLTPPPITARSAGSRVRP